MIQIPAADTDPLIRACRHRQNVLRGLPSLGPATTNYRTAATVDAIRQCQRVTKGTVPGDRENRRR